MLNPTTSDTSAALSPEQVQLFFDLLQLLVQRSGANSEANQSPYLTVEEAASYCRLSVQKIYNNRRYIERLPGTRKLLFKRETLDKWLASRRKRPYNSRA